MAVVICEGELGAGVGTLAANDQPAPLGPGVEVDVTGRLSWAAGEPEFDSS